jgi:predicted nuclease with TOPRIM domain
MEEFRGLTAEMYQAIVAIVDDRLREVRVTREGFERLEGAIARLAEAQAHTVERVGYLETRLDRVETALIRLAEAQARTEERVGSLEQAMRRLAEAQARTEERVGSLEQAMRRLAEAQARTEERVGSLEQATRQLAEAQARTEERVGSLEQATRQLAEAQARTEAQLGRLAQAQARTEAVLQQTQAAVQQVARQCEGVVCDIEDTAYIVLYDALKRELGWEVGVLERTWQRWNGEPEEVNIFGRATDPTHPDRTIWIVGEAKHNLTLRETDRFAQQVERARQHLQGEVCAVCFAYRARPEVRARLQELGIPLLFSYGRFA